MNVQNAVNFFGTIDTFLIWRLTNGAVHATGRDECIKDVLLFNIRTGEWDDELLQLLNVPRSVLPEVKDCASDYGTTRADLFGAPIPINGVAGDQQAVSRSGNPALRQAC